LTKVALVDQPPAAVRLETGVMQPLADLRDAHLPLVLARQVRRDRDQINVNADASAHDLPRFPPFIQDVRRPQARASSARNLDGHFARVKRNEHMKYG
jgi:hypothetical protein